MKLPGRGPASTTNIWGGVDRGERNPPLKQLLKIAHALGVEPRELFIIGHEEPSATKLQAMIQELLREAARAEPQLAYKLLKAMLK
jgi:transcriptional regulator with XRE-family HTH domain